SATARTPTPPSWASATRASGASSPSDAIVCVCRSIRIRFLKLSDAGNGPGPAGGLVHVHDHGVELCGARCHLEAHRHLGQKTFQDALAVHADDAIARASHPDISDVGGALRQHALVSGLHVGVSANHGAAPAVQVPSQRNLLAGGLGVHVHDDNGCALAQSLALLARGAKRIVELLHEHAALEVDDT